jgi:hypothetical protein
MPSKYETETFAKKSEIVVVISFIDVASFYPEAAVPLELEAQFVAVP